MRAAVNAVNGTTLCGLAVAAIGRARLSGAPEGLLLATRYRLGFPVAGAFTVGNVVVSRRERDALLADPSLLVHEGRHATQYAVLGPAFLPLYLLGVGWSWARCGDWWSRNPFERLAGLADGHYVERPARPLGTAVAAAVSGRRGGRHRMGRPGRTA